MEKFDLSNKNMRSFGLVLSAGFMVLAVMVRVLKHTQSVKLIVLSLVFLLAAVCFHGALRLVYPWWMRLAQVLAWVNTRILLFIMFYCVFTPVGLVMRLFKADLLDMKLHDRDSYWHKKEITPFCAQDYEKRF